MSARKTKPRKGRRPRPDELLAAVPFQNEAADVRTAPQGTMLVSVPLKKPRWLVPPLTYILPFSSERRVELDEIGSEVFQMCDGEKTVESIIEKFAENHKLSFRESQIPVTQFLEQLSQRGLIAIVGFDKKANS